ncbi:AzlC family ABC transporter permease [Chitinimonas sp.]|uniref:AzlC family ABC transporter permease n=1 Tax=Chitinimonas sp. TaxID=1934313 RepID=UPI0035B26199
MHESPTPAEECWRGARDTLPMLLGAAPFGLIFGTLAGPSGLSVGATLAMSLLVFAGSSQFIALTLVSGGASLVVIMLTTLVVNLRHALYSATLLPHVAHLPHRWRAPLAFWLTDESFAVVQQRYAAGDGSRHKHWYFLGSCLAMYGNWFVWTLAGVVLGRSVHGIDKLGLEFAMAATFTGIVAPMLCSRPMLAAAAASAVVALLAASLPYKLGLMLAAVAGVVVGVWLEGPQGEAQP